MKINILSINLTITLGGTKMPVKKKTTPRRSSGQAAKKKAPAKKKTTPRQSSSPRGSRLSRAGQAAKKPVKKPVKKVIKKTIAPTSRQSSKQAEEKIKVIKGKEIDLAKEKPVGKIVHYYGKIKVGVVEVHKGQQISIGETVYYSGHTTDFDDVIKSMQDFGKDIETAKGKKQVGVKVKKKLRKGDKVFKIIPVK